MNLNVPLSPQYMREICDYNRADRKNIQRSIKTCNWTRLFINLTINERVELFSNTLFRNYIPNKTVKFSKAPCINKKIKSALSKRSTAYNMLMVK